MPQSLAAVYLHIIFSTKNRRPLLRDREFRLRTHSYLGGIANAMGCQSIIVGGVEDHVHMLTRHSRTETIAKVIGTVKSKSSAWIKDNGGIPNFEWQDGYGAYSVSPSVVEIERRYIANQEEHHKTVSYEDEFRKILMEHGIEFDEKYVWD